MPHQRKLFRHTKFIQKIFDSSNLWLASRKLYESFVNDHHLEFFSRLLNDLIGTYRKGHSCQLLLVKCIGNWKNALDKQQDISALLMDLPKAFDCLQHDLIITELHAYGLELPTWKSLFSYVCGRKQRVKISNSRSSWSVFTKRCLKAPNWGLSSLTFSSTIGFSSLKTVVYTTIRTIISWARPQIWQIYYTVSDKMAVMLLNGLQKLVCKLIPISFILLCFLPHIFGTFSLRQWIFYYISNTIYRYLWIEIKFHSEKIVPLLFHWGVNTSPSLNSTVVWLQLLKLGHGWVIIYHNFVWKQFRVHALK